MTEILKNKKVGVLFETQCSRNKTDSDTTEFTNFLTNAVGKYLRII